MRMCLNPLNSQNNKYGFTDDNSFLFCKQRPKDLISDFSLTFPILAIPKHLLMARMTRLLADTG